MFIKVPIYFEITGSVREVGLLQDLLSQTLENEILGRKKSVKIEISGKDIKSCGLPDDLTVSVIRRDKVLDGLR